MALIHINLTSEYRGGICNSPNSTAFYGRSNGEQVRKLLSLDKKDTDDNQYIIVIPTDTSALNVSFFLGLFLPSIKKIGMGEFDFKYRFDLENLSPSLKFIINGDIKDGFYNAYLELSLYRLNKYERNQIPRQEH